MHQNVLIASNIYGHLMIFRVKLKKFIASSNMIHPIAVKTILQVLNTIFQLIEYYTPKTNESLIKII